jgi:hypothetical protein
MSVHYVCSPALSTLRKVIFYKPRHCRRRKESSRIRAAPLTSGVLYEGYNDRRQEEKETRSPDGIKVS